MHSYKSINLHSTIKSGATFRGNIYAHFKYLGKKVFNIVNKVFIVLILIPHYY